MLSSQKKPEPSGPRCEVTLFIFKTRSSFLKLNPFMEHIYFSAVYLIQTLLHNGEKHSAIIFHCWQQSNKFFNLHFKSFRCFRFAHLSEKTSFIQCLFLR